MKRLARGQEVATFFGVIPRVPPEVVWRRPSSSPPPVMYVRVLAMSTRHCGSCGFLRLELTVVVVMRTLRARHMATTCVPFSSQALSVWIQVMGRPTELK